MSKRKPPLQNAELILRSTIGAVGPSGKIFVRPSCVEEGIRKPQQQFFQMSVFGIPRHRHRMEIQPVLQSRPERERSQRRTLVQMQNRRVVLLLKPRPPIGERSLPTPQLLPVPEEERVGVQVDPSEPVTG